VLACAPATPPPVSTESALGGASFVLWPPAPDAALGAPEDNPWLTGAAIGSGGGLVDGASGGALGSQLGAGGTSGAVASGGGGSSSGGGSLNGPETPGPARLVLRAYVESPSTFKGVMVEHVAGGPSASCSVDLYSNGSTKLWRSLAVPTGLELGQRAVLCIPEGGSPACSVGFGGSVFNGNDALVLSCAGQAHDVIGVVGVDPGKGWAGPGADGQPTTTVDAGLWRCAPASSADGPAPASAAEFDSTQWVTWDWASDASWQGPVCPQQGGGLAGAGGQ